MRSTNDTDEHLFGGYGKTKWRNERTIIQTKNKKMLQKKTIWTIFLYIRLVSSTVPITFSNWNSFSLSLFLICHILNAIKHTFRSNKKQKRAPLVNLNRFPPFYMRNGFLFNKFWFPITKQEAKKQNEKKI